MLEPLFRRYGYEPLLWSKWRDRGVSLEESGKVAIKQFPYTNIYGRRGKTEWLLVNNDRGSLVRIEVKTQRGSGSVDEKLPYMYLNAVMAYPENDIILLVDGQGFDRALPWLKKVVEEEWLQEDYPDKNIQVMNQTEFTNYFITKLS